MRIQWEPASLLISSSLCHTLSCGETAATTQPEKENGICGSGTWHCTATLTTANHCQLWIPASIFHFENLFLTQFSCGRHTVLEWDEAIFTGFLQRQLTFYVTSEILPQDRTDHLHNVSLVLAVTGSLTQQIISFSHLKKDSWNHIQPPAFCCCLAWWFFSVTFLSSSLAVNIVLCC